MTTFEYFNHILQTEFKSNDELPFSITRKSFKKGEVITLYGQIERHVYFLVSGLVEVSIRKGDDERILDFFLPGRFVNAYTSFLMQQPSDVQVSVLIDCEVDAIHYSDIQAAYKTSLVANQLGRITTESFYIISTNREKDFLTKSAQERYDELFSKRPALINLIPVHKIAKYLGIQPESLSRLRKIIS